MISEPRDDFRPTDRIMTVERPHKSDLARLFVSHSVPLQRFSEVALNLFSFFFKPVKKPLIVFGPGSLKCQFHPYFLFQKDQSVVATRHTGRTAQPVVRRRAYTLVTLKSACPQCPQRLLPELEPHLVASALGVLRRLLLGSLCRHADHEVFGFRCGYDLLQINENLFAETIRDDTETLGSNPVTKQPKYSCSYFLAKVAGDKHHSLIVVGIEIDLVERILIEELTDLRLGIAGYVAGQDIAGISRRSAPCSGSSSRRRI